MIHRELAVIKDNGIKNDYRVNFELINSKRYHDKFVSLTEHKIVDEAIYKQACKILEHRSGTEYEDIAILDARTGKFIIGNNKANGAFKHKCALSPEDANILYSMGKKFEILHNHPNSSKPSPSDIKWLFKRENAVASNIICHDGTIYRLEKLKSTPFPIDDFISDVSNETKKMYSGWPDYLTDSYVSDTVIEILTRNNYIRVETR